VLRIEGGAWAGQRKSTVRVGIRFRASVDYTVLVRSRYWQIVCLRLSQGRSPIKGDASAVSSWRCLALLGACLRLSLVRFVRSQ